ncbi:hypothetical protein [Arthrobacter sp. JCM 19049]|uniref:hypothetical protein n=1 Tax=Arthrobacter sp. JCM 19049 TaxID=1460643 RepID=UPI000A5AE1E4|nr:hypothetical protein [Arthrobacter sp. JCM 19049]
MARTTGALLPGQYPIDTGLAEIEPDPYGAERYILKVNGVPSSHIDLNDPTFLDFEYMRWMQPLFGFGYPAERFDGRQRKLRVLHLGGGGCTMARWVAATYDTPGRWWWNLTPSSPSWCAPSSRCPGPHWCACGWGMPRRYCPA